MNKIVSALIIITLTNIVSSCSFNKKNSKFFEQVAEKANQKYKCKWTSSSFDKIETCRSNESVYGYEDECLHVFFKKTKGSVYITVGKKWGVVGVEYIHHKEESKVRNSKGSHSYCNY
jgi:hypothetical protein